MCGLTEPFFVHEFAINTSSQWHHSPSPLFFLKKICCKTAWMTVGQTATWTECQSFSSRRRPNWRRKMMRLQPNAEWVIGKIVLLGVTHDPFNRLPFWTWTSILYLITVSFSQGLQRRATPHPSELKVMKKVIEERRNEAYTSKPDGEEESHDSQVHSYNLKMDFVAPNSLGHTSNYLPPWSQGRSTFYVEKPLLCVFMGMCLLLL